MFFNPDFAKILNETEYKKSGKSITKNFIDAILRLFKTLFPDMNLNDDSVLKETTEVMIELLENSYKGGAKSTKKSVPIISKEMVENDAVAKGLIDEFSSTQVEKPSSNEFIENAIVGGLDMSQAGLFDDMLSMLSKSNGSSTALYAEQINKQSNKLFDSTDKELKKGSVVEYNGQKYLYWNTNKSGKAQLINTDGTKFSGTPNTNKLTVLGSYKTTIYNNIEYIVTDNNNIYSGATGNLVYTGKIILLSTRRRIINKAKEV